MLGLSKTAKILFFREPEVLETGMIMPHEKEKSLVYACIQKKLYIWLTPKIFALDNQRNILIFFGLCSFNRIFAIR